MSVIPGPIAPYFRRKKGRLIIPTDSWYDSSLESFGADPGCTIWAYQSIGVASYEASLVNLADPGTDDLTTTAAPAWNAAQGWVFTAANNTFLDTGIVPTKDYSWLVRFRALDETSVNSVVGEYSATNLSDIDLYALVAAGGMVFAHGIADEARAPVVDWGVFGMAGTQPYRNGAPDGAALSDAGGWTETAVSLYLGALNNNDTGSLWNADVTIQAFCAASCILDAMSMMFISWAMASL